MIKVSAYGVLQNPLRNIEKEQRLIQPIVHDLGVIGSNKSFRECLANVSGMCVDDISWGRVVQKESISAVGNIEEQRGKQRSSFMCAFVETSTAVELFNKDRNMDRRNVEERTFSTGGKIFDFTV